MEIVAFSGRLVGAMLDPLVVVIACAAVFAFKSWPIWLRLLIALAAMFAIGLLIQFIGRTGFLVTSMTERMAFALLATTVWFWIVVGFRKFLCL